MVLPTKSPPAPDSEESVSVERRLVFAWGATLLVLMAATWPLWTPDREAPRVAFFSSLESLPQGCDWIGIALVVYGVVRGIRSGEKLFIAIATIGTLLLLIPDQLRWQPWAYHALLVGLVVATCRAWVAINWLRYLTISIYAYSAVAKLDATYASTLGQQLLTTLASPIGVEVETWPASVRVGCSLIPPVLEFLIAGLLAASLFFPRLRTLACLAAAAMHGVTIAVLGPWAMAHSLGVLLWNIGFAWQTFILFWPTANQPSRLAKTYLRERLAIVLIALAMFAPVTSPWGGWDRWPSWGLYAPAGERVAVFLHERVVDRLPEAVQSHVELADAKEPTPWRRLRIDRWVLQQTRAPVYPQNRVRLALAIDLAERYAFSNRLRVVIEGRANRFTGERTSLTLEGVDAIKLYLR